MSVKLLEKTHLTSRDISFLVNDTIPEKLHQFVAPYKFWIIMDGGFIFGADLARAMYTSVHKVDFIHIERGYDSPEGPHPPRLDMPRAYQFDPDHVNVFVDIICDQGVTFALLTQLAKEQGCFAVTCALVARANCDVYGYYLRSEDFLTGYGMGPYRELPYISAMERP